MKRPEKVTSVFVPRCDAETNPATRAEFRAQFPAEFEVQDASGQKWFETADRRPLSGADDDPAWFWPGMISSGDLTVIQGDSGVGKSYVVLDMIARVTRGTPFPAVPGTEELPLAPQEPGKVVLITLQDHIQRISKRLSILKADRSNLHVEGYISRRMADCTPLDGRKFDLKLDLPKLRQELQDLGSVKLVVFDPVCDFCQGPAEVEHMLSELRHIAWTFNIPVVATLPAQVRFDAAGTLKVTSRYRTEQARAVWCLATHPQYGHRRFFIPRRMNQSALPLGVEFRIDNQGFTWRVDRPVDPADPLGWETDLRRFLTEVLTLGPHASADLMYLGQYKGYCPKQIRAVAYRMGVGIRKCPGFGKEGSWEWFLPDLEARWKNEKSLENVAENTENVEAASAVMEDAVEFSSVAPPHGDDWARDLDSAAPHESKIEHASAKANFTDTRTRNTESLANAQENAKNVVVALAATEGAIQHTTAAPPNSDDSGRDLRASAPNEPKLKQASAHANATDARQRHGAAAARNSESLENTAKSSGLAPTAPLTKRERRKQARRERKLIRKARERSVGVGPAESLS
ncbi:MAG: AAA family ATPase [Planctomycetes bacterium]|nr:AAA family ATPase [Planctomycetota bacterium]